MKEPVGEGRTVDAVHASAVGGARRQPDPSGNVDMCAQSEDIIIPGNFALLLGRSSEMRASMLEALPADFRNRMEEHANNIKSMIDEVIDVHIHLEKAEKTIIDQSLHIATRNLHSYCS